MRRGKRWTRLERLEEQQPERAWLHSEGLYALLLHAQQWPTEPFDIAALGEEAHEATGLPKLLKEAWQGLPWSGITALPHADQSRLRHE